MTDHALDQLRAIAHPLRYNILAAIRNGEKSVGEIEEISGISQPALSQQLAFLRKADLVRTRREAKLVYYAINSEQLEPLIHFLDQLRPSAAIKPVHTDEDARKRPASSAATFAKIT